MSRSGVAPHPQVTPDELSGSRRSGPGPERVVEIQRARVLAAMVEVSCERGAANATVAYVVERAGVSRRTFYELFDDREQCFLAALERAVASVIAQVAPAFTGDGRWRDRMRRAVVALLGFLEDEPSAGRLLIVETLGAGSRALERRQEFLDGLVSAVQESREARPSNDGPPHLTAEGVVGGVLSVLHTRLLENSKQPLIELVNPLTSMIVLPYLGSAVARRELERPRPESSPRTRERAADPLRELDMRLTYRTVRVLCAVRAWPGASNKEIGVASGAHDQGQISKLLGRLERLGLIHKDGVAAARGAPNAWTLTEKGLEVEGAMSAEGMTGADVDGGR